MQGLGAKIGQDGKFAKFSCRENFMFYSTLNWPHLHLVTQRFGIKVGSVSLSGLVLKAFQNLISTFLELGQ